MPESHRYSRDVDSWTHDSLSSAMGTNIVIHNLPADVCETRGEDYLTP